MNILALSLFKEMFSPLKYSILGKAIEKGIINFSAVDIRRYSPDKVHFKCDDAPFGGGNGMIMSAPPIYNAVNAVDPRHEYLRIYLSPKGKNFNHKMAQELSTKNKLLFLCGRYEGVDQRAIDLCMDTELSIGDFILTGGEFACLCVIDAICRFVPGVLGNENSLLDESFSSGLLEYPQYTRPAEFMGKAVPEVLVSGNHKMVKEWRQQEAKKITSLKRPDLLHP